jgi:hypothetical protein
MSTADLIQELIRFATYPHPDLIYEVGRRAERGDFDCPARILIDDGAAT